MKPLKSNIGPDSNNGPECGTGLVKRLGIGHPTGVIVGVEKPSREPDGEECVSVNGSENGKSEYGSKQPIRP